CHELRLAIEIDGDSHDHKIIYDSLRQKELETFKIHFVRFDDLDVKKNIGFVLNELIFHIQEISSRE
ncbi:hypothetical protein OB13_07545, partial [Pontibacter sp. HJ8]